MQQEGRHRFNKTFMMTRRVITTALLAILVCRSDETVAITNNNLLQNERSLASKTYCPPDLSGRVPTENCKGYVECVKGVQGNNFFECPPGTIFDIAADTCNWPDSVAECKPYIAYAYAEGESTEVDESNNYCPAEYSGRAPTSNCAGYVNCVGGETMSEAMCQQGTAFHSETQMCVSDLTECKLLVELKEGMSDELILMDEEVEIIEEEGRIVYRRDCSGKYTGKAAINDCTGYIECDGGVRIASYNCTAGTLFDRDIGLCNWKTAVHCASSSPSMKPTPSPSTASPTPYDPNNVYYPKFAEGLCINDGMQPEDVDRIYLFSDLDKCCDAFFSRNEECYKLTPPPTDAPTTPKGLPKIWYPDYVNKVCKKDGNHGPYEQNFFTSYDECCKFDFMDEVKCLENKPALYYADYDTNTCTSQGEPSPYEDKLFMTHQECCEYDWIHTETCVSAGDGLVQYSAAAGAKVEYYPDLVYSKCKCDGKQKNTDQTFASYEECCEYPWINKYQCMKHAHDCTPKTTSQSLGLWYPVKNSKRCKNDGSNPDGVLSFTSYQVCCFRSMPDISKQCEVNSKLS